VDHSYVNSAHNYAAGRSSSAEFDEEDVSMAEVLSRQIGQMISANPGQGLSSLSYRNQVCVPFYFPNVHCNACNGFDHNCTHPMFWQKTTMQDMERMEDLARRNITVTNVAER
jgi:hypothetical protein